MKVKCRKIHYRNKKCLFHEYTVVQHNFIIKEKLTTSIEYFIIKILKSSRACSGTGAMNGTSPWAGVLAQRQEVA